MDRPGVELVLAKYFILLDPVVLIGYEESKKRVKSGEIKKEWCEKPGAGLEEGRGGEGGGCLGQGSLERSKGHG